MWFAKGFYFAMDWAAIGFIVWVDLHRTHGISEHVATFEIQDHPDFSAFRIGELVVYSSNTEEDNDPAVSGVGVIKSINELGLVQVMTLYYDSELM